VNRFAGRGFISSPGLRRRVIEAKYGVIPGSVKDKRVILVDDSIVRGSTASRLTRLLRAAGAREVHLRSAAPPVAYPCFLGVDIPTRRELVAHGRSPGEVAGIVDADTVLYATVEDLVEAVGLPGLCLSCFTGTYWLPYSIEFLEERFSQGRR